MGESRQIRDEFVHDITFVDLSTGCVDQLLFIRTQSLAVHAAHATSKKGTPLLLVADRTQC